MKDIIFLKGTQKGSKNHIKQHQAIAQGYMSNNPRQYKIDLAQIQAGTTTGSSESPGKKG